MADVMNAIAEREQLAQLVVDLMVSDGLSGVLMRRSP